MESVSKERKAPQPQGDQPELSGSDESLGEMLGLGEGLRLLGLATTREKKTARGKIVSSSSNGTISSCAMTAREMGMPPMDGALLATLEKLAQQTQKIVGNIDAVSKDNVMGDELVESLMKQVEELGVTQVLMQSMQNCGQLPSDIVKQMRLGLDLDPDRLPMLLDFSALGPGGQPNCNIM